MVSWNETCAVCGKELAPRGNRRLPIPSLRGRKKKVHPECAELVEQQQTLDLKKAS
jgi:hypothetical protein